MPGRRTPTRRRGHHAAGWGIELYVCRLRCLDAYHAADYLDQIEIVGLVSVLEDLFNVLLTNDPAEKLADYLCESSNGAFVRVGFVSGGSEAVEAALKTAIQVRSRSRSQSVPIPLSRLPC